MAQVHVQGLRELRRALKAADSMLPKVLNEHLKDVAMLVVERARAKIPSRSGRTAGSIRPGIVRGGAAVRAGGARVPWYGWLDFGGVRRHMGPHHHHDREHLQPGRPAIRGGRYLYPAADEVSRFVLEAETRRALDEVFRAAGFVD
jgi:hypothetical protein